MEHVPRPDRFSRGTVGLVAVSTALLTAAFLGVLAVLSGDTAGFLSRLPIYFLTGSILFVALLFAFEEREFDGRMVILSTVALALVFGALVVLIGEGSVFLVRYPDRVLSSQLLTYFLSAGVVCTGLAYWGLHHWREFVP